MSNDSVIHLTELEFDTQHSDGTLPTDVEIYVTGSLNVVGTLEKDVRYELPENLVAVNGEVDLDDAGTTKLPPRLHINGYLSIQNTPISELPAELSATDVYLYSSQVWSLPTTLQVDKVFISEESAIIVYDQRTASLICFDEDEHEVLAQNYHQKCIIQLTSHESEEELQQLLDQETTTPRRLALTHEILKKVEDSRQKAIELAIIEPDSKVHKMLLKHISETSVSESPVVRI